MIKLSNSTNKAIKILNQNGYKAYAVGGAIRDLILGRKVSDYDVTTNALPNEIKDCFNSYKVIETGIKHGTITVIIDEESIEITTFRVDGEYLNNRKPKSVEFVSDLKQDLSRRDFTINALAYNEQEGVIDYFDGIKDAKNKIINAVGEKDKRFKEDALCILRALRFSSTLNFKIEEQTKKAILNNKELLNNISKERIFAELKKMIMGDNIFNVLMEYHEVFFVIIPELRQTYGFDQKNKYHAKNVYEHIAYSVSLAEKNLIVRLSLLFHDIGKPLTCKEVDGVRHFKNHAIVGGDIAESVLKRLKADNKTINKVKNLIYEHDNFLTLTRSDVKLFLRNFGIDFLQDLTSLRIADSKAHFTIYTEARTNHAIEILNLAKDIIEKKEPYTLKDLDIKGQDLLKLGYGGEEIKTKLEFLYSLVINEKVANKKELLIKKLKNE